MDHNQPVLMGQKPVKSKLVYVRNICKNERQSDEAIVDMVKQYGRRKDVRIMSARVVHNRFE